MGTPFHQIYFNLVDGNLSDAKEAAKEYSFSDLRAGLLRDSDEKLELVELSCLFLLGMIEHNEFASRRYKLQSFE